MVKCVAADGRKAPRDCEKDGSCKLETFKGNSLCDLVAIYKQKCLPCHPGSTTKGTFQELLKYAKMQRWHGKDVMDTHQRQLHKVPRECFAAMLEDIKLELMDQKSFEDIYRVVSGGNVPGIGQLTLYDTALRLCLPRGMQPQDVYLHRGAWDGAKCLNISGLKNDSRNKISMFPPELQELEPWEIENFLCVCKNQLLKLSKLKGEG